jgi:hypothetical protein
LPMGLLMEKTTKLLFASLSIYRYKFLNYETFNMPCTTLFYGAFRLCTMDANGERYHGTNC